MEVHTCLLRENMSNLLLGNGSHESVEIDKGQSSSKQVTTLGPGNMALATPALVTDQESTKKKGKRTIQETDRPEEQVNVLPSFLKFHRGKLPESTHLPGLK